MRKYLKDEKFTFLIFTLLCLFRFSFFGFYYAPYLDDYVQYGYYSHFENPLESILLSGAGTALSRPFAAFSDVYIFSHFWGNLSLALIILTFLFSLSGIVFYKALKKAGFFPSPFFLVLYSLLPTLTEGTFWISGATRLVPAMLFSSLAVFFMQEDKKHSLPLFYLSSLFACGFYEQGIFLVGALILGVFIKNPKKYFQHFSLGVLNILIICAYYLLMGGEGDNKDRMVFSPDFWKSLSNTLSVLKAQIPLYTKGFLRSIEIIKEHKAINFSVCLFLLCFLFSLAENKARTFSGKKFLFGLCLFFIPLLPFFILENSFINFRNLVPSCLGFAILCDSLLSLLKKGRKTALFILSSFLIISNVAEVYDYTKTAVSDRELIYKVAENLSGDIFYFPETEENYYPQTSPFGDHIISITGSDWGLTGTVRQVSGNRKAVVIRKKP